MLYFVLYNIIVVVYIGGIVCAKAQKQTVRIKKKLVYIWCKSRCAIERLVVAQLLTDKIMQKFSPVAFDTEKYAQFANGYVLKNADELLQDMEAIATESENMFQDDAREITFEKAGKAYDDMTREKVEIIEANDLVNKQVVPPIQDAPIVNGPIINKN